MTLNSQSLNLNARQILFKRLSTVQALAYTGPLGEIIIDANLKLLRVQDGVTAGGHLMMTSNVAVNLQSQINSIKSNLDPAALDSLTEILANVNALLANNIESQLINSGFYANLTTTGNLVLDGSLLPKTHLAQDLGSATKSWRNLYISNATAYFGNSALTITNNGLQVFDANNRPMPLIGNVKFPDGSMQNTAVDMAVLANIHTLLTPNVSANLTAIHADVTNATSYFGNLTNAAVSTLQANLQSQIDYIKTNINPAALDSLTEIVTAFQGIDANVIANISTIQTRVGNLESSSDRLTSPDGTRTAILTNDGILAAPGSIRFPYGSARIYGNNDLIGLLANVGQTSGLEIGSGTTAIYNEGNVVITSNTGPGGTWKNWTFSPDGGLRTPNSLLTIGGYTIQTNNDNELDLSNSSDITIRSNVGGVSLGANWGGSQAEWRFEATGNLSLPVSSYIKTTSAGDIDAAKTSWEAAEYTWVEAREYDAANAAPTVRPWAGLPSYEAYNVLINNSPLPPGTSSFPPIANSARQAYLYYQDLLAATYIGFEAGGNLWKLGANGNLTLPQTAMNVSPAPTSLPGITWTDGTFQTTAFTGSSAKVDIVNTNGLTTTYYPTFVESRTSGQYIRADVDLTYRTDSNLLRSGNIQVGHNIYGSYRSGISNAIQFRPNIAVDKRFLFTVDSINGEYVRSGMEMPGAEIDKAVTLAFPHTNSNAGFIYIQGSDSGATEFNDAFNIMMNSGNVKISALSYAGGNRVWTFDTNGNLTLPQTAMNVSPAPTSLPGITWTDGTFQTGKTIELLENQNFELKFQSTSPGGSGNVKISLYQLITTAAGFSVSFSDSNYFRFNNFQKRIERSDSNGFIIFGSETRNATGHINDIEIKSYGDGTNGNVYIAAGGNPTSTRWAFQQNGKILFPDASQQSTAWTGAAARVQSAPPASPVTGQMYYDTDDGNTYIWTGAAWIDSHPSAAPNNISTGNITNGTSFTAYGITVSLTGPAFGPWNVQVAVAGSVGGDTYISSTAYTGGISTTPTTIATFANPGQSITSLISDMNELTMFRVTVQMVSNSNTNEVTLVVIEKLKNG